MATVDELLEAIDNSGERVKIVLHYYKPKDGSKDVLGVIQFGNYKCLANLAYDRSTLAQATKVLIKRILDLNQ